MSSLKKYNNQDKYKWLRGWIYESRIFFINKCYRYFYIIGPTGPQGSSGGILNYADFYALMPKDNSATVAPGTDVSFPQDGPNSGVDITRTCSSTFNLSEIGTY